MKEENEIGRERRIVTDDLRFIYGIRSVGFKELKEFVSELLAEGRKRKK